MSDQQTQTEPTVVYVTVPEPFQLDELNHAILVFVMGWFWFVTGEDVDVFSVSTSWSYMSTLMTQRHWSMLFAGVFITNAILWNASGYWLRAVGAAILALAHSMLALMFYVGNPHGTAFGPYFGYALIATSLVCKNTYNRARIGGRVEAPGPPRQLAG